jgi:hypothetical protein
MKMEFERIGRQEADFKNGKKLRIFVFRSAPPD